MSFVDREITCLDCSQPFVFTAGEQEFYERKGFKEEPKRCKPCREARKQRRVDTPVTPRAAAPRAAASADGGFGFRGSDSDAEPGNGAARAYSDDDDDIGNRAFGVPSPAAPARPRSAPSNGNGGFRHGNGRAAGNGNGQQASRGERSDRSGGGGGGGRELHEATCAQCGGSARVPFKPVPGRPVYCRDCFASRAASAGGR